MSEQKIRAAIQALLDEHSDGWSLGQFVIAMGLERIDSDGRLKSTPWLWSPPDQPDWMTGGLLDEAMDMRAFTDTDTDL